MTLQKTFKSSEKHCGRHARQYDTKWQKARESVA